MKIYKLFSIGILLILFGVIFSIITPSQTIADKIKEVVVANFPALQEVLVANTEPIDVNVVNQSPDESTTKVLGSRFVHIAHGDLVNLPLGRVPVLYASYSGSGKMTYLFARGQEKDLGITIQIDGVDVAQTDVYNLDILPNSDVWRLLQYGPTSSQFEVVKEYPFKESLKIYLWNNNFGYSILGGAHIEIEVD